MFSSEFYPTPRHVIERMTEGIELDSKVIYEPQAGSGNIVDYCTEFGAEVIASELHNDLRKIIATKCKVIGEDCMNVTSDQISHINAIISNPPFSAAMKHTLHLYDIAPEGCIIRVLCPASNIQNDYTKERKQVSTLIDNYGYIINLGKCFSDADRETNVEIYLLCLQKPGENYQEFDGFFLEEDEEEEQANAIMSYNVVRDLVNRYVAAIKIYDKQLETAVQLNELTSSFFGDAIGFQCKQERYQANRNEYKKDLQKAGWMYIFKKMDLDKYATRALKEDINKFVEQQTHIPFTMRNIYRMLEIVAGTASQRIDKAVLEVFEKLTQHHDENRLGLEGWKTNSHYLLNKKFIHPNLFSYDHYQRGGRLKMEVTYDSKYYEIIDDLIKALCYITGHNYENIGTFYGFNSLETEQSKLNRKEAEKQLTIFDRRPKPLPEEDRKVYYMWHSLAREKIYEFHEFNKWYEFGFFRVKGFKKGTAHFEFLNDDIWAMFNQRVAKLKGYPLFEGKTQTKYQNKQTGRADQDKSDFRKWQDKEEQSDLQAKREEWNRMKKERFSYNKPQNLFE